MVSSKTKQKKKDQRILKIHNGSTGRVCERVRQAGEHCPGNLGSGCRHWTCSPMGFLKESGGRAMCTCPGSTLPSAHSIPHAGYIHLIKHKAMYQLAGLCPGGLCPHPSSQGKQDWARSAFELKVQKMKDKGGTQVAQLSEQSTHGP